MRFEMFAMTLTALRASAWYAAVAGGLLSLAVGLMTVYSVVQRALTSQPIQGDIELVQLGIAISISLCIAWCQLRGSNIIVDFFTSKAPASVNRMLDGLGCLMLAVMYGVLSIRTLYGAVAVYESFERTALLDLPGWWTYAWLAPGLALGCAIALVQAWLHFTQQDMKLLTGDAQGSL
jgi:TRAP-type C4-dicarboxylate transport system permease small subunit